jgi:hypothetical protein
MSTLAPRRCVRRRRRDAGTRPGYRFGAAAVTAAAASDRPFGPDAAAILATEHWSLLGTRSLIWNEAMSRATIFLTVLSASIIALALLADATGFGSQTTTLALVLLPVVLLLGIATYAHLAQINSEEFQLVLAMNRLRHAYLKITPGLEPHFTTGHHDDEQGLVTTYMLYRPSELRLWLHFLVNTPTILATVDAALASVIVVLIMQVAEAPTHAMFGRWGSGVPGGLGSAALPTAAHAAPTARHDAEVPHSAACTHIAGRNCGRLRRQRRRFRGEIRRPR